MAGLEFNCTYDLLGVRIHLATDSVRVHEEARMFLGAHQARPGDGADYRFVFEEASVITGFDVPHLSPCRGQELQVLERDHRVFFSVAEGMACYDPQTRTARGQVFPLANGHRSEHGTVPLVHLLVLRIMLAEGFLPLHAAAVNWRGKALVLSGAKGAGKSTLALRLHGFGFPLICDDLLYLKRIGSDLVAGGHCQAIKIKEAEAAPWLDRCEVAPGRGRVPGKTLLACQPLNPEGVNGLYSVAALVCLDHAAPRGAEPTVWPDREVEVLHRLLGDSPLLNNPVCRARALELLWGEAEQRFFLAQPSANPEKTARAILRALDHA